MKKRQKKRILKWFALLIIICGVSIGIKYVFFPDENEKIRKTISLAVSEIEKKDINSFIRHFTLDYRDCFDNTYGTLYILLRNNIDSIRTIDIDISQIEIDIEKSNATVRFFATFYIKTTDGEDYKDAGRFILKIRKEDLKWRVYRLDEMGYEFD
ncbi:MAG TPA: hypothetical protein P5065_07430 [Candidatus Ratteibacteria bacterium]|jgi:hypothetical protein|uniref:Lumazine-binding domain protein n=1 Tax=candidate division TA06 bacterium ADurb.Bin131 TaxID=1852827 RepID=A0A1V6C8G6_UNCT6|nr:MAG: hypothetical protein BWX89_01065 [candidate division TA06 bacterium ADurb.Bin131]HON05150.1 hypothetical protein [bacterium]HRS06851.1 hypothetical protein [Candidatus Ratteibacteria bacterium]OQB75226.1 MAG: hypothetical protein BWX89_00085 [candidate division TA06 bacterium ADurb.Bin131]HPC29957.1 hypothetical protein [bacterium]